MISKITTWLLQHKAETAAVAIVLALITTGGSVAGDYMSGLGAKRAEIEATQNAAATNTALATVSTLTPTSTFTPSPTNTFTPIPTDTPIPTNIITSSLTIAPSPTSTSTPSQVKRLDTVIGREPLNFDPSLAIDTMSIFFIRQMFVGLTDLDSNGKPIPSLATEWDVSDDGLEWTFNLRDDIYWVHRDPITGNYKKLRPVTAADVVYGVVRTLHPDTDSEYAYVLYIIEGAEELNNADPTSNDFESILSGIKVMALDDKTVVFRLRAPAAYFPSITSMPITYPQPQEVIKEKEHNWTEVGFIVTNGAYTVQEWKPNEQIILEKNVEWYDADNVEIELLSTRVVSDTAIALKLYKDGKIDFLSSSLIYQLQIIDEDDIPKSELYVIPKSCTEYYGFINSKPPFDNKLLRRAFSATINRELLIENVIKGEHIPANSFSAPGIFGSMAQNPAIGILLTLSYSERVTLAKSWLEEAGYPEGEGIEIVLGFNTSKMKKQVAEEVRRMWLDAFPNATITLKEYEWSDYIATLKQDTPDDIKPNIYRLGWCADYPDANNFLNDVFHSKSKQNLAKYSNPDFDKIIEQAASEKDSGERMKLYFQAEAIFINQDTAIAPIYYHTSVYLHKSWLTGVVFDQFSVDTIAKWRINWDEKRSIGTFISLLPHPERPEGTGPIP